MSKNISSSPLFVFITVLCLCHISLANEIENKLIEQLASEAQKIIRANPVFKETVNQKTFSTSEQKEFFYDMNKYENFKASSNDTCRSNVIDYLQGHNLSGLVFPYKNKVEVYKTNKTRYVSNRTHSWTAIYKVYDIYEVSVNFVSQNCSTECEERELSMESKKMMIPLSCRSFPVLTIDSSSLKYKLVDKHEVLSSEKRDYGPKDEEDGSSNPY